MTGNQCAAFFNIPESELFSGVLLFSEG